MIGTVEAATLRAHLSDTLDTVEKKKDYLLVSRRHQPAAALVNLDFLEDLLAATSNKYLRSIREARAQAKAGKLASFEDVFGKL